MPATAHFAALQRQDRPRRWSMAVTLAAATGLFANLVLEWPLALLAATVTVVGLLLWDRWHGTLMAWWPGDGAPHRLAAAAARLEHDGWTVLRNPDTPERHTVCPAYLLIGPGGVFVVEHQIWTVDDTVSISPTTGLLLVAGRPAARRTATVRATAAAVTELLSVDLGPDTSARPVLAIDGPTLDQPGATVGVTILPTYELTRYLRRTTSVLSAPMIATLTDTARRLLTPRCGPT